MEPINIEKMKDEIIQGIDESFWKSIAFNKAIPRLLELLASEKDEVVLRAATEILARAYGKPTERHELTGKNGKDLIPESSLSNEAAEKIRKEYEDKLRGVLFTLNPAAVTMTKPSEDSVTNVNI